MRSIDEDIKSGNFSQLYVLYGSEEYLKKVYCNKLIKALTRDGDTMNFTTYEEEKPNAKEIIDLAETLPFLAERRVILIKNSGYFKSGCDDLVEYFKEICETTCFVFVEHKVDKGMKMYKAAQKAGRVIEMTTPGENDLMRWIASYLGRAGKKVRATTVRLIMERCGTDMSTLVGELEKLISYVGERDVIENEDVACVCTVEIGNHIFAMIDAIAEKRQKDALNLYYELLASKKEDSLGILSLIARQFNLLMQVKEISMKNSSSKFIAEKTGLKEFVASKYITRSRSFSYKTLRRAFEECVETNEAIKSGRIKDVLGVELLIVKYSA